MECAEKGVEAFKQMQPLPMVDDGHNGKEIVLDPIQWWASRAHDFPLLAQPAQHVLTIPASQAQSERLFTSAGLIMTKKRLSLSADNVELLVSLRNSWAAVVFMRKSWGTAQPTVMIF